MCGRLVGRELGVRYVLEGSVRKAGARVRITCQLVNALTGSHVWADRFDSNLGDIFELQDRVTESVAGVIEPTLRVAEIERALDKPTNRLDAYDLLLRARFHLDQNRRSDCETALRLAREAIGLDPRFAQAKAAAVCIIWGVERGWWHRGSELAAEGIAFARAALATAPNDTVVLAEAGLTLGYLACDNVAGRAALDRALALNPNSAETLTFSAWLRLYVSDWRQAHDEFIRALRLSPRDHYLRFMLVGQGYAMIELGEAEAAIDVIQRGIVAGHGEAFGRNAMIDCLVTLGRVEEARTLAQAILADKPWFTVAHHRQEMAMHESSYLERILASLRAAGIPEG
jgi:adenylate cyclase